MQIRDIDGFVKWFDKEKGFGFVEAELYDVNIEFFLHIKTLEAFGFTGADAGSNNPLTFDAENGADGRWKVVGIHYIYVPKFAAKPAKPTKVVTKAVVPSVSPYVEGETLSATVKWFNGDKGYGYLIADNKEGDLFVHKTQLRPGLQLAENLAVTCEVGRNDKGFHAMSVRLPGEASPTSDLEKLFLPTPVSEPVAEKKRAKGPKLVRQPQQGDVVAAPEAAPAPNEPKVRPRKRRTEVAAGPVVDAEHPVSVTELPDSPFAAAFAKGGLVQVQNGFDHSASTEGQSAH